MSGPTRRLRLLGVVVHAWCALLAFDLLLLAGFRALHAGLRRCRANAHRSALVEGDLVWSVEEACVWYCKRAACLQRSAVTTWLLRRHGVAAEMVIGFRPLPFESHAWVEVDGRVVNDRPQYQRAFRVLDRL